MKMVHWFQMYFECEISENASDGFYVKMTPTQSVPNVPKSIMKYPPKAPLYHV